MFYSLGGLHSLTVCSSVLQPRRLVSVGFSLIWRLDHVHHVTRAYKPFVVNGAKDDLLRLFPYSEVKSK